MLHLRSRINEEIARADKGRSLLQSADWQIKLFCVISLLLAMLVLGGAVIPKEEVSYRFISPKTMYTLDDDSSWRVESERNEELNRSFQKDGDRDAKWVYIFRQ